MWQATFIYGSGEPPSNVDRGSVHTTRKSYRPKTSRVDTPFRHPMKFQKTCSNGVFRRNVPKTEQHNL